jgi:putative hemolysin
MAVVVDEFGMNQGIVTPVDVLESIAGELPEAGEELEFTIVRRPDGSWLVDGRVPVDEFEDRTGVRGLRDMGEYNTIAGFVLISWATCRRLENPSCSEGTSSRSSTWMAAGSTRSW